MTHNFLIICLNIRAYRMCSQAIDAYVTVKSFGFGSIAGAPRTTFVAKLVKQSNATVVPIYFHSRKYYLVAQIAPSMRTGLLMNETNNKFGSKIEVAIGGSIPWSALEPYDHRQTLIDVLYNSLQSLKCK
ncbi:MAG: hypothetical protein JKX81_13140 [Arenicella sp.]|nr:hypothetical protein [Arenicella sp.]